MKPSRPLSYLLAAFLVIPFGHVQAEHTAPPGTTRVAQWKDDKQAAFTLGFDDGIVTQLDVVIPELQKRKMVATFYLNPGSGEYKAVQSRWEKAPETGVAVLGDHTMTHRGVKDMASAEIEIGQCAEIIRGMTPAKRPTLVSFAQPGVGPGNWNITGEEYKQVLANHHLIDRGDFRGHGAMFHVRTADEMTVLADTALAKGGVEYIVFHSIARGTIPTPEPIFMEFMDKLEARADRLWLIDHISAYKYEQERKGAEIQVLESSDARIRLELKSSADSQLFDYPLTLITQVPGKTAQYQVMQGAQKSVVPVVNGTIRYEALPNSLPIVIQPVGA